MNFKEVINMKWKYTTERMVNESPLTIQEKVNCYLKTNHYKIIEKGIGYIIFDENEFSESKRSRHDFHERIGKGKFVFDCNDKQKTFIRFSYFIPFSYYMLLIILISAFGIYTDNIIMPILFSIVLTLPIFFRIIYLNEYVFSTRF